ncbi:hypothetical protein AB0J77_14725 [Micromonospora tulbaghiae]|uniref:hypothetical protein n=1 Tax=Micromonospora tulbaghiae TaxID=479978 RepID=UPI003437C8FE
MTADVKSIIRRARLPEDEVPLCLRADLVKQYEQVEAELAKLHAGANSLAGPGERAAELEETLAGLREQMAGSTLRMRLRALPSHRFQALVDEHPSRVVDENVDRRDRVFGFNVDTFFPALIAACTVDPVLDAEDWESLLGDDGKLTDGQVGRLADKAWKLNKKDINVPF